MARKFVMTSGVIFLLAILGAGYYQFQKVEPLSEDAKALIATVQYPEYKTNLNNRNFFMAVGIEAATDTDAEALGRLRYHKSWELLTKSSLNGKSLDQDAEIKKYLEHAVVLSAADKSLLKEYRQAINLNESLPFVRVKQAEIQSLVTKFSVQIDRYATIYNQDYRDLPMSALGLMLPDTTNLLDMHTLLLAKISLSPIRVEEKNQQYQQYFTHLRQVEVVSDLGLISQSQNLRKLTHVVNIINELAVTEEVAVGAIKPLTLQEMSVENALVGEMLFRYRDTGSLSQTEFENIIPKEISVNQMTAAILPVIELSKLPYPQMLSSLAQGVSSKPYSAPIKYIRYKHILDIKSESKDFIQYAIAPRILDYRIHLFNAIQSGLPTSELNTNDAYGQFEERGQKLCLTLPKEFKTQFDPNDSVCLKRPVK